MPKLRQTTPEFDAVAEKLRGKGANGANLSKVLGCAPATARKKLSEPKYFTLEDLSKASRHYGIPADEVREALVK